MIIFGGVSSGVAMYPGRPGAKSPSANGPPNNKPQVVSDQQAREKLAVSKKILIFGKIEKI